MSKVELNTIYNEDCRETMSRMPEGFIDLVVTSPPYFNAREYSHWETFGEYMEDMETIFSAIYEKMKNHKYCIVNVGDVTGNVGKSKWAVRKLPLGAYFTIMMEKIGYQFVEDYIWDKGEPQTKRHLGNPPFPFYQYPVNCYEHILVFAKHKLDKTKIPCPDCNEMITSSNSCTGIGIQSWECKNPYCPTKSEGGRGKRFSMRSVMMNDYKADENIIPQEVITQWRRDIVKISPVIKINSKGENKMGHSAPYPEKIPEMAIRFFSGCGDVVYDPFIGSGTTAKVSRELNRNFIGSEISEEFVAIANKRIEL